MQKLDAINLIKQNRRHKWKTEVTLSLDGIQSNTIQNRKLYKPVHNIILFDFNDVK